MNEVTEDDSMTSFKVLLQTTTALAIIFKITISQMIIISVK